VREVDAAAAGVKSQQIRRSPWRPSAKVVIGAEHARSAGSCREFTRRFKGCQIRRALIKKAGEARLRGSRQVEGEEGRCVD